MWRDVTSASESCHRTAGLAEAAVIPSALKSAGVDVTGVCHTG